MDTLIREGWTANLRSGLYQQGTAYLETSTGEFCCLGVLCDMAVKAGICERNSISAESGIRIVYGIGEDFSSDLLPHVVRKWAGLDDTNPDVETHPCSCGDDDFSCSGECYDCEKSINGLADLNDNGASFIEIADLIDASL